MLRKILDLKYFIAVFIVLELLSFVLLDYYFSNLKREHLHENAEHLQTEYRAVFNSYSLLSRTLFNEAISRPDILEVFKDAYPADETKRKRIRDRLFQKTDPIFKKFKQKDFKLLQFHLPDGTSFLRVHKPDEFGDNLFDFRYSVKLVNTRKKYIEGFEQGRLYSGFRFIFPLSYKDLHIGSVETAISFNGLRSEMEKLFPSAYFLIVKQDSVLQKLFKNEQKHYMKSDISDEYLYELTEMGTNTDKEQSLKKDIFRTIAGSVRDKISEDIKKEEIFAIYVKADNKAGGGHYAMSFLPVRNFDGTTGAYIISLEKDATIADYERNFQIILILLTLLLLVLLTFVYIRKRTEKEIITTKQMLEDITDGITESILLLSKDFKVVWANKAALQQTGLSIKELVGNYCYKATHARECPCEPPTDPCPVCKLVETGNPTMEEHIHYDKNGKKLFVEVSAYPIKDKSEEVVQFVHIAKDITERKRLEQEREELIHELQLALDEVKTLSGLLPICSSCKKIRDDKGYWNQIEVYIRDHSEAEFTHAVCPECAKKLYPEYYDRIWGKQE